MNKIILSLLSSALLPVVGLADTGAPAPTQKDLSKAVEKVNYVETDVTGVRLNGYVDTGYEYNFYNNSNALRWAGADTESKGNFNVNAVKLTVQKDLTDKNEWQAGFRTDILIGSDWGNSGNKFSSSSLFLEQGYVTFRAPLGNGLDFKVGQFASWLGYEAPERPANLNITYGDTSYLVPSFFTGVSAEYKFNNLVNAGLAVVDGANLSTNTGFTGNGLSKHGDGYGVEAKVNFTVPGGNANWQHVVYYSWDSAGENYYNDPFLHNGDNWQSKNTLAVYDGILSWTPKFAKDKLLLAANYDLGTLDGITTSGKDSFTFASGGIYAKYQFTDVFSLASRGTYVHTDNNQDLWSFTITAGFNVAENLILRTEYRYDLGNGRIYDGNYTALHNSGHTAAIEAVYTF